MNPILIARTKVSNNTDIKFSSKLSALHQKEMKGKIVWL